MHKPKRANTLPPLKMKHTDWAGLCAAGLGSHRTSHLPMPLDHAASGSPRGLVVAELSLLRTAGVELLRFHGMAGVFFSTWLTHLCSPWLMHLTLGGWGTSAFQHVPSRLWNHYKIKKKKSKYTTPENQWELSFQS